LIVSPKRWFRVALFFLTVVAMTSQSGLAADSQSNPASDPEADLIASVYADLMQGNALRALKSLRDYQHTHAGYRQSDAIRAYLSTVYSQIGLHRQALEVADWSNDDRPTPDLNPLKELKAIDAVSAVLRLARDFRIVMVNEAHPVARHRALMIDLLSGLREQGYNYFAAETLSLSDTALAARGYPVPQSGFYTLEPMYGELIRTALRLGFKVVAYEPENYPDSEEREEGQASNLIDRVFKNDPTARLVVYAGYGHIAEGKPDRPVKTLAQRLKLKTGMDPLTVDQEQMREHASREYEEPLFQYAADTLKLKSPSVFVDAAGSPWTARPGMYDVTVFLPRSVESRGRPKWQELHGSRRFWKVPANFCAGALECLLKARFSTESDDAIPVDQLLINAKGNGPVFLLLPKASLTVTATDVNGTIVNRLAVPH
jgi:hypothetical protein